MLSAAAQRIAILDDDPGMHALIGRVLGDCYHLEALRTPRQLHRLLEAGEPDLLLLDLSLGDGDDLDGLDVLRAVRARFAVPAIIVSGWSNPAMIEAGLELGADDYVPKPFEPAVLRARIRSVLRRLAPPDRLNGATRVPLAGVFDPAAGPLAGVFDPLEGALLGAGDLRMPLTERECHVLAILCEKAPCVATRNEVSRRVLGADWNPADRSLDVHVSRVRRKLDRATDGAITIAAVRGTGYRLVAADGDATSLPGRARKRARAS